MITVLALGRIGAIYTPIFSGYAAPAVATRLADCDASVLVTADGFLRRGSWVPLKAVADEAAALAPTVRRILVVRRAGDAVATPWNPDRDAWWHEEPATRNACATAADSPTDPETPYLLIYTSGTTGRPKAAVHVHGGFPIKGAQDLAHQFDLRPGDTLFWFTDLGWMMGPWAISGALLLGARLVLYEGAPDYPGPDRLWAIVERHKVTHLGLSPTVIRALMAHGEEPVRSHDLGSLRVLGSTGEPWNPEPWWWYFREVGGGRCPIINYSGGTEVSGGIVSGNLLTPIKPTAFSGPCIGTAADVVDDAGRPLRDAVGELVIRAPLPGMTRGFWRDPERYEETYWSRFPGMWVHGDWARIDPDGHWFILGRSDDTLKIAGKRVGPAEVESAAVGHPAVLEAAAIGVPHEIKGEAVVVMAVLRPGVTDDDGLRADIGARIAGELGKPLRPEAVEIVRALPKTRSGKVMRRFRPGYLPGAPRAPPPRSAAPRVSGQSRRSAGARSPNPRADRTDRSGSVTAPRPTRPPLWSSPEMTPNRRRRAAPASARRGVHRGRVLEYAAGERSRLAGRAATAAISVAARARRATSAGFRDGRWHQRGRPRVREAARHDSEPESRSIGRSSSS